MFGHGLRQAELLGWMGRVASSADNARMESFWFTMQRELLVRRATWASRVALASAIFGWIEGWYNPRRLSSLGYLSPHDVEALHAVTLTAA